MDFIVWYRCLQCQEMCLILWEEFLSILRPHAVKTFKMFGESYIRGIMEGEGKGMVERKEVFEQSVNIC
jgi:hypothetical protein